MKFLIDTQKDTLARRVEQSELILGQLLTPLTGYSDWGGLYAVDNGAFSGFPEEKFQRLLQRQSSRKDDCLFVTCPDVVGGGQRSIELFKHRKRWIPVGWRVAMVAQDGMENLEIPWSQMDAVFIGGRDPWKDSQAAADIVKTAKILGLWVHVGRVNTPKRFDHFSKLGADSCDGSGVAMYDHMLEKIEHRSPDPRIPLFKTENCQAI
jgi:hypothetical protein